MTFSGRADTPAVRRQHPLAAPDVPLPALHHAGVHQLLGCSAPARTEWGMNNTMAGMIFSVYQLWLYPFRRPAQHTHRPDEHPGHLHHRRALVGSSQPALCTLRPRLHQRHDPAHPDRHRHGRNLHAGAQACGGAISTRNPRQGDRHLRRSLLVLGASLSLAVTGWLTGLAGWRIAFICCSVGVCIGALLSVILFRGYRPVITRRQRPASRRGHQKPPCPADDPRLRFAHVGDVRNAQLAGPLLYRRPDGLGIESGRATGWASTQPQS